MIETFTSKISDEVFYLIQDTEIKIRGRYLRFSANVEGLMVKCTVLINEVKLKRSGTEIHINFKNFMFRQKLKKLQSLLLEIFPDLSQSYAILFGHIDTFREMRNKMAHCYFQWDDKDLNSVLIWDSDEKSATQIMEPSKYLLNDINNSLTQSMKNIMYDLNKLTEEVTQRTKSEVPYMF